MKPKSAIFIAAALTAFVLATLFGVVNALKNSSAAPEATQPAAATNTATQDPPTAEPAATATATQVTAFGPMEAVSVASNFINRQDVYSVESSTYNQTPAFKVTFSSGDVVYVGLDGQVITATKIQPVVVNVAPTQPPKNNKPHRSNNSNNNQPANTGGGEGDHEGGD